MTAGRDRRLPWIAAVLSAALWSVTHVLVHRPRGWPQMHVWGEWDFLLTAQAIAAGHPPDAVLGAMHGNELGSYVVAAGVAALMKLGLDVVVAAKVLALSVGASIAGLVAGLSAWLAREGGLRTREAATCAVLSALLVSCAWPGMHFELAGLSGRTPESVPLQLAALALVVTVSPDGGSWLGPRALLAGASLGLSWLLSPVTAWTALACGLLCFARLSFRRSWGLAILLAGVGFFLPVVLFGALVPGGWEGLELFRVEQLRGAGVGDTAAGGARPGVGVLAYTSAALEGGAHNPSLVTRDRLLSGVGFVLVGGLIVGALRGCRTRTFRTPGLLVALVGLSWFVPLALLPEERWFYPLAYRYWGVMLALAMALFPTLLVHGRFGSAAAGIVGVSCLVVASTLPRSVVAPAPPRAEALVSATAHSLGPRPGHDRHAAFWALMPHAAAADQPALSEGYGLMLGADFAVDMADGRDVAPPWQTVAPRLLEPAQTRFLVGVGCGMTVLGDVSLRAVQAVSSRGGDAKTALLWGLGRCGEAGSAADEHFGSHHVFEAGRAGVGGQSIRSSVSDPKPLLPPRW